MKLNKLADGIAMAFVNSSISMFSKFLFTVIGMLPVIIYLIEKKI